MGELNPCIICTQLHDRETHSCMSLFSIDTQYNVIHCMVPASNYYVIYLVVVLEIHAYPCGECVMALVTVMTGVTNNHVVIHLIFWQQA